MVLAWHFDGLSSTSRATSTKSPDVIHSSSGITDDFSTSSIDIEDQMHRSVSSSDRICICVNKFDVSRRSCLLSPFVRRTNYFDQKVMALGFLGLWAFTVVTVVQKEELCGNVLTYWVSGVYYIASQSLVHIGPTARTLQSGLPLDTHFPSRSTPPLCLLIFDSYHIPFISSVIVIHLTRGGIWWTIG